MEVGHVEWHGEVGHGLPFFGIRRKGVWSHNGPTGHAPVCHSCSPTTSGGRPAMAFLSSFWLWRRVLALSKLLL